MLKAVFWGEEVLEAAGVFEDFESFLILARSGGEHEHEDDQIFADVLGGKVIGFFPDEGATGGGDVEVLAIGMIAIAQAFNGLAIDLSGGDDPEDEPGLFFAIVSIDEADGFDSEEGFAAAGGDFEAEVGEGAVKAVFSGEVVIEVAGFFPGFGGEVNFEIGILKGFLTPVGKEIEVLFYLFEGFYLVFFEFHIKRLYPPTLRRGLVLGDKFIYFKGQLGKVYVEVEKVFLIEVFGGGKDKSFFLGFSAQFFSEVEGEGGGFEVLDIWFIN